MSLTRFAGRTLTARTAALAAAALMSVAASSVTPADATIPPSSKPLPLAQPAQPFSWAALPLGRPPVVAYVRGHRYVTPHGPNVQLPIDRQGVSGVVAFSGGLLVSGATYFEGTDSLDLVKHGTRVRSWPSSHHCSSGTPVASPDSRYAAWVTVRCPETDDQTVGAVHRARRDGSGETTQPVGVGLAGVVGFLGRRVVYNSGFQDGAWVTDFRGDARRIPGVDRVGGESQDGMVDRCSR